MAQIDLVYASHRAPISGGEPPWVAEMRRWARGHHLPDGEAHAAREEQA